MIEEPSESLLHSWPPATDARAATGPAGVVVQRGAPRPARALGPGETLFDRFWRIVRG